MVKLDSRSFNSLSEGKKVFFVFDYDGTLAPINPHDNDNYLSEDKKHKLNSFADKNKVAILTGRSFNNFSRMLNHNIHPEIMIFGTHGAEINEAASLRPHEAQIKAIKDRFTAEAGVEIEEKELSITIHYKQHKDPAYILNALHNEYEKYQDIFRIQEGFKYFEFLPKSINKGTAIDYLKKDFPDYHLAFFGDDFTDNDAFERINVLDGISVQVGDKIPEEKRIANYKVDSFETVYEIIEGILNVN